MSSAWTPRRPSPSATARAASSSITSPRSRSARRSAAQPPAQAECITGNANVGILLVGEQAEQLGTNDVVQGNLIGLNAAGQVVNLGGGISGNGTGILVSNSPNDLIGGTSPADRNVISGNSQSGIQLFGVLSTGDTVLGNFIGTNLAGDAFPAG